MVEDDDRLRGFTEEALTEIGYRVDAARTGEDAMTLLRGGLQPDLVLTDVIMPGLTGPDLARQVRAMKAGAKIVFMSGYAHNTGEPDDMPSAEALIKKPFTIETLSATVAAVLSREEP